MYMVLGGFATSTNIYGSRTKHLLFFTQMHTRSISLSTFPEILMLPISQFPTKSWVTSNRIFVSVLSGVSNVNWLVQSRIIVLWHSLKSSVSETSTFRKILDRTLAFLRKIFAEERIMLPLLPQVVVFLLALCYDVNGKWWTAAVYC